MKKVLSCFLLLGSFSSFATVIQYNDFSDTTGLTLNGNTQVVNNNLQLTNNIAWQGGSVFTTNAISLINDSSFATSFSFKIDNNSLGGDTDGLGADGLAFVIQTQNANVGGAGGGLGYQGINNSVAVEFDTFNNTSWDNNNGNHVGIGINGNVNTSNNVNEPFRFNEGDVWNVLITFDGISKLFDVSWSMETDSTKGGSISRILDVASILGSTDAFLGFTSGTGSYASTHEILSATFTNTSSIPTNTPVNAPATFSLMMSALAFLVLRRKKQILRF